MFKAPLGGTFILHSLIALSDVSSPLLVISIVAVLLLELPQYSGIPLATIRTLRVEKGDHSSS